jgi:hypothetical protein
MYIQTLDCGLIASLWLRYGAAVHIRALRPLYTVLYVCGVVGWPPLCYQSMPVYGRPTYALVLPVVFVSLRTLVLSLVAYAW